MCIPPTWYLLYHLPTDWRLPAITGTHASGNGTPSFFLSAHAPGRHYVTLYFHYRALYRGNGQFPLHDLDRPPFYRGATKDPHTTVIIVIFRFWTRSPTTTGNALSHRRSSCLKCASACARVDVYNIEHTRLKFAFPYELPPRKSE